MQQVLNTVTIENSSDICVVCSEGKQTRLPFRNAGHRATSVLEIVYADLFVVRWTCHLLEVPYTSCC